MNLKAHEQILQDALGNRNIMSSQALSWIITANKLCDLHQLAPERHFDNAPNREILCDRWKKGLKTYMDQAIELSAPARSSANFLSLLSTPVSYAMSRTSSSNIDWYCSITCVTLVFNSSLLESCSMFFLMMKNSSFVC